MIIVKNFIIFGIFLFLFIFCDNALGDKVAGKYYLFHFINNLFVTFYTYQNLIDIIFDLYNYQNYITNFNVITMTVALHIYHVISYYKKLRFDDWLHHILMIIIVLPTSIYMNVGSLLGYGLFFLTGLPGGIDYFLLFLVRNNIIDRMVEKKINYYLNIWIRCPGCITHAVFSLIILLRQMNDLSYISYYSCLICITIIFWNGVYFMNQVVQNYTINKYILEKEDKNNKKNN